jgi:peptidoglycan/xylan/chitin deacetylase (PgdA/CDA1 family)
VAVTELKAAAWKTIAGAYYYSGFPNIRHRGQVAILIYHRVVPDDMVQDQHIQAGMYVRTESFAAHVDYFTKRFSILSLDRLLELLGTDRLDDRTSYCVITFDDGWQDNYRYAFPILKSHGIPATIFLATDYIGTARWFWPDQLAFVLGEARRRKTNVEIRRAIKAAVESTPEIPRSHLSTRQIVSDHVDPCDTDCLIEWCKAFPPEAILRLVSHLAQTLNIGLPERRVLLNWEEVKEMAASGISFGPHSCSHRILTGLSPLEAKKEMTESWQALLQQGIKPLPVFCYPNGNCNAIIKGLARDNGYVAALGCDVGLEGRRPADLFSLKRISLHEDTTSSPSLLALALSGFR